MPEFFYNAVMEMTLEKILQHQGFGSRKLCRNMILDGRIEIGGKTCTDPKTLFKTDSLNFSVDGKEWEARDYLYIVLHKPAGYECSHQPRHHSSVFSLFPHEFIQRGLQCVGRLDQDTTGLLLFSDDGNFIHRYTSPQKKVAKVYDIATDAPIEPIQIEKLKNGVQLKNETVQTKAFDCQLVDEFHLKLVITEGKYHQVKRMVAAAGNHVEKLHRSAIGGYSLEENLSVGQWRYLDETDLLLLNEPVNLSCF